MKRGRWSARRVRGTRLKTECSPVASTCGKVRSEILEKRKKENTGVVPGLYLGLYGSDLDGTNMDVLRIERGGECYMT